MRAEGGSMLRGLKIMFIGFVLICVLVVVLAFGASIGIIDMSNWPQ